jgi:hypothetical protein
MHVGPIGLSHRDRDAVERRFQNPGQDKPVTAPKGAFPLLIGLWEQGTSPVLVGMDATDRLGKDTRQSLFIDLSILRQAAKVEWAEYYSDSGELIVAFRPALLPRYIKLRTKPQWSIARFLMLTTLSHDLLGPEHVTHCVRAKAA